MPQRNGQRAPRSHERAHNAPAGSFSGRFTVILIVFALVALGWAARLVYLQVFAADRLSDEAAAARTVSLDISPRRGTIYDRNGNILASSVDATTIYANPKEIEDVAGTAEALAETLGGQPDDYKDLITQDTTFVYLKRKADVDVADRVRSEGLKGIYFIADTKRVYPYGEVAGQVIGFVNIDGVGISGLELYYDDILSGTPGKMVVQTGLGGIPIPGGTETEIPAVEGQDIIVSIDIEMQRYLEETLSQAVEDIGGEDGTALIMDAASGEMIACASTPYFNPADTSVVEEGSTQVKGITNAFEPGSIFKTVSAMALLEAHAITPDDEIFCPAEIEADGYKVSDAHDRSDQTMTFREILDQSSNVGISLAVEDRLGFLPLYDKIVEYGLNEPTGIDYPGEAGGYLLDGAQWSLIQSYNVSFGQGISVTPLQMVRFYGAILNDGVAVTPHFLIAKPQTDEVPEYETEAIITDQEALDTMVGMLQTVVSDGTGRAAAVEGFHAAGKTGTAEIASETGGYKEGYYNLDFVGFIPDSTSSLVCFVGVNEVPYERQTTQVFSDIMTFAAERYKVVPTKE